MPIIIPIPASFDEANATKKFEPLSINQLKDIDSVVEAVSERLYYSGNVVLGKSSFVEKSSGVTSCNYVYGTTFVNDSNYVAYSRYVHFCEYCFGFLGTEKSSYIIMGSGSSLRRCFECHMVQELADCYYCAKTKNSQDCLFCFGVENKMRMIGNSQFPKEKYHAIKTKLLSDIAQELKREKCIFSLLSIFGDAAKYRCNELGLEFDKKKEPPFNQEAIESAFSNTSQVLFGKPLGGIFKYAKVMQKHNPPNLFIPSCLSGSKTVVCGYRTHLLPKYGIGKRMATEEELQEIGFHGISPGKLENLPADAEKLAELLHPVAYFNLEKDVGTILNVKDSAVVIDSANCLTCAAAIRAKNSAYTFWPSDSENIFGGFVVFNSSFVMDGQNCDRVARGFELDNCRDCADVYFLHNCENVRDSMFCFNAKNMSYAIGNSPLPPEQYRKVKASIAAQIGDELERKNDLKWDIFNIGIRR